MGDYEGQIPEDKQPVWYGTREDRQNVNRDTGANEPTRRRNVLSLVNESPCHSYSSLIPSRPSLSFFSVTNNTPHKRLSLLWPL